ncbi:MAG TPA: MMPL family transporter, partial [Solirubrobacterales bacterium]
MSRRDSGSADSRRSTALGWVASVVVRRPRLVIAVWGAIMAVLAVQGLGLDQKVSVNPIYIGGSLTQQEHELALQEFGSEDAMVLVLRGPPAAVEHQGRRLGVRLESIPRSMVVTPWTPGRTIDGLRPAPGVAALMVSLEHREGDQASDVAPLVQRAVDESVAKPVEASVAGAPAYEHSFQTATEHAAAVGERLALPVLVIVLLLVFRSVLAAAIPAVVGGIVVGATRGVLDLLAGLVHIDSFAIGAVGMMGLALGVDYSLLVVSRFREEVQKSDDVAVAVRTTILAIGRSILPAASGLILAMLVASQVVPGAIAVTVSVAIIVATVLSALSALVVVPSFLMLVGSRLDRWALPMRRRTGPSARARWLSKRPALALPAIFVLCLCAALAFTLDTGIASFALLPPNDPGRLQSETVQRTLGPGWTSPMEIIMDGGGQPVTTPRRLRALASFQHQVERDPGVQTMAGFAALEHGTDQLEGVERTLVDQEHGLTRLNTGLLRAHSGAVLNTNGLLTAAAGARQLDAAIGLTQTGAGALASGLQAASSGSDRLSLGLNHASDGSGRLAQGASKASTGLGHLTDALSKAEEKSGETSSSARLIKNAMRNGNKGLAELDEPLQNVEGQLGTARQALLRMSGGRADPQYAGALQAIEEATKSLTGSDPQTEEPADPS